MFDLETAQHVVQGLLQGRQNQQHSNPNHKEITEATLDESYSSSSSEEPNAYEPAARRYLPTDPSSDRQPAQMDTQKTIHQAVKQVLSGAAGKQGNDSEIDRLIRLEIQEQLRQAAQQQSLRSIFEDNDTFEQQSPKSVVSYSSANDKEQEKDFLSPTYHEKANTRRKSLRRRHAPNEKIATILNSPAISIKSDLEKIFPLRRHTDDNLNRKALAASFSNIEVMISTANLDASAHNQKPRQRRRHSLTGSGHTDSGHTTAAVVSEPSDCLMHVSPGAEYGRLGSGIVDAQSPAKYGHLGSRLFQVALDGCCKGDKQNSAPTSAPANMLDRSSKNHDRMGSSSRTNHNRKMPTIGTSNNHIHQRRSDLDASDHKAKPSSNSRRNSELDMISKELDFKMPAIGTSKNNIHQRRSDLDASGHKAKPSSSSRRTSELDMSTNELDFKKSQRGRTKESTSSTSRKDRSKSRTRKLNSIPNEITVSCHGARSKSRGRRTSGRSTRKAKDDELLEDVSKRDSVRRARSKSAGATARSRARVKARREQGGVAEEEETSRPLTSGRSSSKTRSSSMTRSSSKSARARGSSVEYRRQGSGVEDRRRGCMSDRWAPGASSGLAARRHRRQNYLNESMKQLGQSQSTFTTASISAEDSSSVPDCTRRRRHTLNSSNHTEMSIKSFILSGGRKPPKARTENTERQRERRILKDAFQHLPPLQ